MAITPPPKRDSVVRTGSVGSPHKERSIQRVIDQGGTPSRSSPEIDILRGMTLAIYESKLREINAQRDLFPKPPGRKIGISIKDWISAAIDEKLERDEKKFKAQK